MSRTWTPVLDARTTGPAEKTRSTLWLAIAVSLVVLGALPGSAEAAWGVPCPLPQVRSAPPDQTWLKDVPEKPGAHTRGKVAVLVFKGDDFFEPLRGAVVRTLRKQQLNVTAALKPADSPLQYREVSYASKLGVFIDGEVTGEGPRQTVLIRLRSGVTGQYFSSAKFTGSTPEIVGRIGSSLWPRVGPAILRACTSATKPRKRETKPLYIEAGSPLDAPLGS